MEIIIEELKSGFTSGIIYADDLILSKESLHEELIQWKSRLEKYTNQAADGNINT